MALIRGVVEAEGMTALVATHDPVMIALADRARASRGRPTGGGRQAWVSSWRGVRGAQRGVLAAVLAVMVAGSAVVGVCVLLATAAPQRALQLAVVGAPAADVRVGVALGFPEEPDDPEVDERVAATARDAGGAVAEASALLTGPFGQLPTTVTAWTSTVMQYLPSDDGSLRLAYLADVGALDAAGGIVSGRWPAAAGEVALPESAARALRLDVGSSTSLAAAPGGGGAEVTVVGTFEPRPGAGWTEDPLIGAGTSPNYRGYISAYGPFVVAPGLLSGSDVPLRRVTLSVQPDLAHADAADVSRAVAAVDTLGGELRSALGDRTQNVVLDIPFARMVDSAREQRGVTTSGVLAVALLVGALAGTAVLLTARLVAAQACAGSRAARRPRGKPPSAGRPGLRRGRACSPRCASLRPRRSRSRSFRVLSSAVGLGAVGVPEGGCCRSSPSSPPSPSCSERCSCCPGCASGTSRSGRQDRVGVVARSGADLLLLALAAAGLPAAARPRRRHRCREPTRCSSSDRCCACWRARRSRCAFSRSSRAGPTRSPARPARWPCRSLPGASRVDRRAPRRRSWWCWRRRARRSVSGSPRRGRSPQHEQAATTVGTDLSVPAHGEASGEGALLREATGGRVSPVTSRAVTLGSRAQGGDARRASGRGRHAGRRRAAARPAAVGRLVGRHGGPGAGGAGRRRRADRSASRPGRLGRRRGCLPGSRSHSSLVVQDQDGARTALPAVSRRPRRRSARPWPSPCADGLGWWPSPPG